MDNNVIDELKSENCDDKAGMSYVQFYLSKKHDEDVIFMDPQNDNNVFKI